MFFRDIIGQEALKQELINAHSQGVVPHARLFVGEDGSGALPLALAYARYINCSHPADGDSCGYCHSCLQFNQKAAIDLHFLFPILNNSKSSNLCDDDIEITAWRNYLDLGAYTTYEDWLELLGGTGKKLSIFAREGDKLLEKLSYRTSQLRYRIILIWLPERMNEALGNKLLKLTEEPPPQTLILMVSQNESQVLGTLRSRMQTSHLRPLSEEQISQGLRTEPDPPISADPVLAAHLSRGNYRRALDIYLGRTSGEQPTTKYFGRILRSTVNARPMDMKALAEELAGKGREEQENLLSYTAQMFREIYMYQLGIKQINYLTMAEQGIAKYLNGCIVDNNIKQLQAEIELAQFHVSRNVNSKMVFFDLLLRLTSILAPVYKARNIR